MSSSEHIIEDTQEQWDEQNLEYPESQEEAPGNSNRKPNLRKAARNGRLPADNSWRLDPVILDMEFGKYREKKMHNPVPLSDLIVDLGHHVGDPEVGLAPEDGGRAWTGEEQIFFQYGEGREPESVQRLKYEMRCDNLAGIEDDGIPMTTAYDLIGWFIRSGFPTNRALRKIYDEAPPKPSKPPAAPVEKTAQPRVFSPLELSLIRALGRAELKGEAIANRAKRNLDSEVKNTLAALVRSGVLANERYRGYRLRPEYCYLLESPDNV